MTWPFDVKKNGETLIVTLDRPDRLNALTFEVYQRLGDFFEQLHNKTDECGAVVICGKGRAFCSGGDQDDIISDLLGQPMPKLLEFTRKTGRLIQSIRRAPVPVIAAISGACVGAGAVIAAACDLRIAAKDSKFGFIFPKVGLCGADMGATYLLPRLVGLNVASELLLFGDLFDGERALAINFVNRLVETRDDALTLANQWASKICQGPRFANMMTKRMIEDELPLGLSEAIEAEAQAQAICMQHTDFAEAHQAFKEKRSPTFAKDSK